MSNKRKKIPDQSEDESLKKARLDRPTSILNIPKEILVDIFTRVCLPIKTIKDYRRNLCIKELAPIFSDTIFKEAQTDHTRHCVLSYGLQKAHKDKFFLIESGLENKDHFLSMKLNMDFKGQDFTNLHVLHSSAGLLLLGVLGIYDRLWIANPLTKECMALPTATRLGTRNSYSLGLDKKSDVYKVVRLFVPRNDDGGLRLLKWDLDVLTVGTKSWRVVNYCDKVLNHGYLATEPVVLKGVSYWLLNLDRGKDSIVEFDIATEKLESVPSPLEHNESAALWLTSIGAINDLLYVGVEKTPRNVRTPEDKMEIWVLNKCCKSGVQNTWEKAFLIDLAACGGSFNSIRIIENELLIMLKKPLKLMYYDPKTHVTRKFRIRGMSRNMRGVVFHPNLRPLKTYIKSDE